MICYIKVYKRKKRTSRDIIMKSRRNSAIISGKKCVVLIWQNFLLKLPLSKKKSGI